MRIFVVGMMAAGKSTFGKKLARKLNVPFFDTDGMIEAAENRSISSIWQENGERYFRDLESRALEKCLEHAHGVIATGGGLPCFGQHMDVMNQRGLTVFLNTNRAVIVKRLLEVRQNRPLVAELDRAGLIRFVNDMLKERFVYYSNAHVTIDQHDPDQDSVEIFLKRFPQMLL